MDADCEKCKHGQLQADDYPCYLCVGIDSIRENRAEPKKPEKPPKPDTTFEEEHEAMLVMIRGLVAHGDDDGLKKSPVFVKERKALGID